jgi:hypothetical protein
MLVYSFLRRMHSGAWAMTVRASTLCPAPPILTTRAAWAFLEQLALAALDVGRVDVADVCPCVVPALPALAPYAHSCHTDLPAAADGPVPWLAACRGACGYSH